MKSDSDEVRLSSEEYKNITLRIKEQLRSTVVTWVVAVASVLSLLVGSGLWWTFQSTVEGTAREVTEQKIGEIVRSEDFTRRVVETTERRLPELQRIVTAARGAADTLESRLSAVRFLPFRVGRQSLTLTDTTGRVLRIEYGRVSPEQMGRTDSVEFQQTFENRPAVFLSPIEALGGVGSYFDGFTAVRVESIWEDGFRVNTTPVDRSYGVMGYSWVAVGRRE